MVALPSIIQDLFLDHTLRTVSLGAAALRIVRRRTARMRATSSRGSNGLTM